MTGGGGGGGGEGQAFVVKPSDRQFLVSMNHDVPKSCSVNYCD